MPLRAYIVFVSPKSEVITNLPSRFHAQRFFSANEKSKPLIIDFITSEVW